MRFDRITLLSCCGGIFLGVLVAVSFGDTPYPAEQKGSACYGDPNDTIACRSAGNLWCETVGVGPDCFYCDGADTMEARFCYGTLDKDKVCEGGSPNPDFDCGQQWDGTCKEEAKTKNLYCSKGNIVIAADGCKELTVECTGTGNPNNP